MRIDAAHALSALLIGGGATALMDGWNVVLKRAFGIRSLDYCMLGRWIRHMPTAFRHSNIATARERRGECAAGWVAHYSIGVTLALAFVLAAPDDWLANPTLPPAALFGLVTVVFPLFVLQPALGLGIASSKTAAPRRARAKSLGTHLVFGLGLYLCAVVAAWFG